MAAATANYPSDYLRSICTLAAPPMQRSRRSSDPLPRLVPVATGFVVDGSILNQTFPKRCLLTHSSALTGPLHAAEAVAWFPLAGNDWARSHLAPEVLFLANPRLGYTLVALADADKDAIKEAKPLPMDVDRILKPLDVLVLAHHSQDSNSSNSNNDNTAVSVATCTRTQPLDVRSPLQTYVKYALATQKQYSQIVSGAPLLDPKSWKVVGLHSQPRPGQAPAKIGQAQVMCNGTLLRYVVPDLVFLARRLFYDFGSVYRRLARRKAAFDKRAQRRNGSNNNNHRRRAGDSDLSTTSDSDSRNDDDDNNNHSNGNANHATSVPPPPPGEKPFIRKPSGFSSDNNNLLGTSPPPPPPPLSNLDRDLVLPFGHISEGTNSSTDATTDSSESNSSSDNPWVDTLKVLRPSVLGGKASISYADWDDPPKRKGKKGAGDAMSDDDDDELSATSVDTSDLSTTSDDDDDDSSSLSATSEDE